MFAELKQNIVGILEKVIEIVTHKHENIAELKELSDHTIHSASIYNDQDAILIAVVVYSLYKIFSSDELPGKERADIANMLKQILTSLKVENYSNYNRSIKRLTSIVKRIDKKYSFHVGEIFVNAKVVKGAMMFKHGLSVGYVADLLNISKWDLMSYVGKTKFTNVNETIRINQRVKYLEEYLS